MKKKLIVFCAMVLGVVDIGIADISTVYDHFDDGILAPSWSVNFVNSTGWTYAESGTNLTVTDIIPTVVYSGNGGLWAEAMLSQTFTPLADFHVDLDFSWNSAGSMRPMQGVGIHLFDSLNNEIAAAEYRDSWVLWRGGKIAIAGENSFYSGSNTMPFDGTASVDISRVGDSIEVLWDGTSLVSGISSSAVSRVDLVFSYYAYDGIYGTSFFESESIDFIDIKGDVCPVPIPGAFLLGSIGLSVAGWKLGRRRAL
jgi:hypothetical protein